MLLIRIQGDVIGVGFRATTQRFAHELNLTGYVRNMQDGTVEIGLDGNQDNAHALLSKLKSAGFTRIDHTSITEQPGSTEALGFEIK